MKPRFHSHTTALDSVLFAPDVSILPLMLRKFTTGPVPCTLAKAWVQVGSISLSCGLPHPEKPTRPPNKDTDQCPSRLQCRSMPRVRFPIWAERNPSLFSLCLLQLLAPVSQGNKRGPIATLLHCLSSPEISLIRGP